MSEALQLQLPSATERATRCARADCDPGAAWVLRWQGADSAARRVRLAEGAVCTVGAHPGNQIQLADPFVSAQHCELRVRQGRLWLRDLGSTNGSHIDGTRVAEGEVGAGGVLRLGGCALAAERDRAQRTAAALPGLVSRDPALAPVLALLRRAAPARLPVLLLGESGTGKEVAARAVHELSLRAAAPFVPLNCGAISAELAEAELFGHEKGAFTGAVGSAPGAFGAADGGTLFLDEIGDLPLGLQVKLLRALESGEVKPVGAGRPHRIDVRIVCATHRDLRAAVRDGTFREDLYYRLSGLTVELPPLRARRLDIVPLAEHFLAAEQDGVQRWFSADAREALLAHAWPGNARELRHVVQLAVLLSDSPTIRAAALRLGGPVDAGAALATWEDEGASAGESSAGEASASNAAVPHAAGPVPVAAPAGPAPLTGEAADAGEWVALRGLRLDELEALAIRAALARNGGNRRATAEQLGIARSSLLRKLDELGLRSPGPPNAPASSPATYG